MTFRRKPESKSIADDVNVTTTCSCLMALAQCSGLTENNAFSTTLVLRTVGLLVETKLLSNLDIASPELKKAWDLYLGIKNTLALSTSLRERSDEASKFLYSALSESTRSLITQPTPNVELTQELEQQTNKVRAALALDLSRLLLDGSIYTKERFPQVSKDTVQELIKLPPGYDLAFRGVLCKCPHDLSPTLQQRSLRTQSILLSMPIRLRRPFFSGLWTVLGGAD